MISEAECGLDHTTQSALIKVFKQHPGIDSVLLYGSRAKGNFKEGSDIDLALVGPTLTIKEMLKTQGEIDDLLLPYKVDVTLSHAIDNPELAEHISRVGRLLYP